MFGFKGDDGKLGVTGSMGMRGFKGNNEFVLRFVLGSSRVRERVGRV